MRALLNVLGLLTVFGLATVLAGWWTVPVVAALWAFARPGARQPAFTAGVVAAAAWAALLLGTGSGAALGPLARLLSSTVGIPVVAVFALTLIFPGILAASAASLVASLRPEKQS